jgi:hypothetical protein
MRRFLLAAACMLVISVADTSAAGPNTLRPPFKAFEFEYTSKQPGTRTGFTYEFALKVPADGSQPPVIDQLNIALARGTKINLGAIPACTADDATITAQGPVTCPTRSRLGTGEAAIWTGPGPELHLSVDAFSTGHGVVVVLESQGNVVAVIRAALKGTKLTVTVPPIDLGPGVQAAIVHFNLPLSGGSSRRPVFTTPSSCGSAGWRIDYRPHFVQLGRVHLAYVTTCKA